MQDAMPERRGAPRFSIILAAEVIELPRGTKLNARSSDLSRTGCYIDTLNPIPSGSEVRIRLTRNSEPFEAKGKVMYVSDGLGMGIAFEDPAPGNQLAVLDRWLADAVQQP